MKTMALALVVMAATFCVFFLLWRREHRALATLYQRYTLMHVPPSGRCPEGFILMPDIFQLEGKSYPACWRENGTPVGDGGLIDRLEPGESLSVRVPLDDLLRQLKK